MARFQSILGTVGHTPVVRINRLAPEGVNLYVKIEAFNPLGSVKDRLALGVIEAAEKSGELKPGQTVIEATSGNTGIGLAMVCAARAIPWSSPWPRPSASSGGRLMRFLGAKVILTPAAERAVGMIKKTVELAETHGWFMTRQFENEANPDFHSRTTAREIIDDFAGDRLDFWVTGYGTGGTLKGVGRVLRKERPETKIIVCEPADAPLLGSGIEQKRAARRLAGGAASEFQASPDAGLDARLHSEADRRCGRHETDRPRPADRRRRRHSLQQGTRGQGRHLCRHHLRRNLCRRAEDRAPRRRKGANILCMLPDTGERYLSTPLFADIPADMTEEELAISRSTPSAQLGALNLTRGVYAASIAIAVASPPPMQSEATPRLPPRACSAAISVTRMRAPEAPIGWPSAQAPPLTLTFSCGRPSSRIAAMATTAKASLISKRSTVRASSRSCRAAFFMRRTGAVVNMLGSCGVGRMRDDAGERRQRRASRRSLSRIRTSAAAPSEIEHELAAVTVPSLRKAGFSVGILSGLRLAAAARRSRRASAALPRLHADGGDLAGESAALDRALARAQASSSA